MYSFKNMNKRLYLSTTNCRMHTKCRIDSLLKKMIMIDTAYNFEIMIELNEGMASNLNKELM